MTDQDKAIFAVECSRMFLSKGREASKEMLVTWFEDLSAWKIETVVSAMREFRKTNDEWPVSGKVAAICKMICRARELEHRSAHLMIEDQGGSVIPQELLAKMVHDLSEKLRSSDGN